MQIPIPEAVLSWQFWATAIAVYVICEIIKQIPYLKAGNNSWIVNGLGVIAAVLLYSVMAGFSGENVIYGILASASATLAYEVWSNILKTIVNTGKVGGTE